MVPPGNTLKEERTFWELTSAARLSPCLDGQGISGAPRSQLLQVADFEEIRLSSTTRVCVQVTDALCDLFHRETGWASAAKQLPCSEDFYQVRNVGLHGGGEMQA